MTSTSNKKRRIEEEFRVFQTKWTDFHFFIELSIKPICLRCKESASVLKEINFQHHYEIKYASDFITIQGQSRMDKIMELKRNLGKQHKISQNLWANLNRQ